MRLRLRVRTSLGLGVLALVGLMVTAPGKAHALRPGKAIVAKKTRIKTHPLRVQEGVLTVDGLTVKTGLNLHVANLHYLYIFVPGSGTAVISDQPFAGAAEQRSAFRGNALTITAGDRRVELSAANRMRGTHSAYVRFEAGVGPGLREPAVSFGDAAFVPAIWPEGDANLGGPHMRLRVKSRRALRTGKLCRPSPHGREMCALVREVVYKP